MCMHIWMHICVGIRVYICVVHGCIYVNKYVVACEWVHIDVYLYVCKLQHVMNAYLHLSTQVV